MTSRLAAQLLAGPKATSVLAVLERCVAIQSQELRAGHLGIRARSTGLSVADVDAALADRSAVVTWVNRGTLHLIRSEDYPWLHALTAPTHFASCKRRLQQEGIPEGAGEKALKTIESNLAAEGPLSGKDLRARLDAAGVRTE